MVTAIWPAAGAVTITAGAAVVDIITAGAITAKAGTHRNSRLPYHCPGKGEFQMIGRALRGRSLFFGQPNPISTAIRIRSEWFLASSFCFSSEVVLATVL
jgi:hypothetical protein